MGQILLVRHGQASWGAADYDQLSELGGAQSRALGETLAARGVEPAYLVRGGLRRHAQTADGVLDGSGWDLDVTVDTDWDEFGHSDIFERHATGLAEGESFADEVAFRTWFDGAVDRWVGGEFDHEYAETFTDFTTRVEAALERTVEAVAGGRRTAVVFTSGGTISWVVTRLLGGGDPLMWRRLNFVTANASVTKVLSGKAGPTLLTYNDHSHFEGDAAHLLTYR
ncbi:broad specificity phosphatase PhoE [Nocardioides massiliensis]|uniref:Broad specificity phosphatase PhoE n=2 Tax=Nocardioides massiliensis TaxID=1325935 RepID=A0ABT9NLW4_9ACTN|nr:histidine phosphatase family protein [Nocardioides massiliensis]MDP9821411.1 broad specificity phosphatase PhoE [Nocardioides massiliensis]